jgi:outer membrane receptor protein involved in Fe transport
MKHTRVLIGALAALAAAELHAGETVLFVTDGGVAVSDVTVLIDGAPKALKENGFAVFDVADGNHVVELSRNGKVIGTFNFSVKAGENAEVKVNISGDATTPNISVYNPADPAQVAFGRINGTIIDVDTNQPVAAASVSAAGGQYKTTSNENGEFVLDVPRGSYDVAISHPTYGKKASKGIRVLAGDAVTLAFEVAEATGDVVEELVATGTYIAAPGIEAKREATSIIESISSEQFSQAGDSDAGAALKRASGVSLLGGQYAVVRGLAGRYISVSQNSSSIPSTNPLSRDVALDLFPASMLEGLEIKKSFTPEMPGDSTGGAVNLLTKGMPEEKMTKISAGMGIRQGVTNNDVITYDGGSRDNLGYDDGTRQMPDVLNGTTFFGQSPVTTDCNRPGFICVTRDELARLGTSLDNNYSTEEGGAKPDVDLSLSHSNVHDLENGQLGYMGDIGYKNKWTARQDGKSFSDGGDFDVERSKHNIDTTAYGVIGYKDGSGNNEYLSKTTALRKSDDITKTKDGVRQDGVETNQVLLQWTERSYLGQVFSGKHQLEADVQQLDWRLGVGQAEVYQPDRREYQIDNGVFRPTSLKRRFFDQVEDNVDVGADYAYTVQVAEGTKTKLKTGLFVSQKDRDAYNGSFGFESKVLPQDGAPEDILTADNINQGLYNLTVATQPTDSYASTDDMLAYYFSTETDIQEGVWNVVAGFRVEDSTQEIMYPLQSAANAEYDSKDTLPALALTWRMDDNWQFRGAYSATVSRPGITERSSAYFFDPETDDLVTGNPDLELSNIDNFDLRAEYYFDDGDNVSVGVFTKDIDKPIEKTLNSSGDGYTFVNQETATVSGIELDASVSVLETDEYAGIVGGNLSLIDSEVNLDATTAQREGVSSRQLQGQSDVLANIQFGLEHVPTAQTVNMVLNYFDDRIYSVGRGVQGDEIESGRVLVDVVYKYAVDENLTLGAKVQNLFDEEVEYTQDGDIDETYTEGTAVSASVSLKL